MEEDMSLGLADQQYNLIDVLYAKEKMVSLKHHMCSHGVDKLGAKDVVPVTKVFCVICDT